MTTFRSRAKKLLLESLESRQMLAADGLHNFLSPLDVNDDQQVTSLDALAVINHINRQATDRVEDALESAGRFLDVSDDALVTPLDALRVINVLSRDASETVDRVFAQLAGESGVRMRAELVRNSVSDLVADRFEIRLQNGTPGTEYPVLVNGEAIGTVVADRLGRGVFQIASDAVDQSRLLEEITQRVHGTSSRGGLVHVAGFGGVVLTAEAEMETSDPENENTGDDSSSESRIRLPDFGMLPNLSDISGPVFAATLRQDGDLSGGAYLTELDTGFSLGLVARGLESGEVYEVAVDGVLITTVTAGRLGVASLLYNSTDADAQPPINLLPEVLDGSVITISRGGTLVSGSLNFLEIPFLDRPSNRPIETPAPGELPGLIERIEQTLVAPLDGVNGSNVDGLVTFTPRGEGYYLGVIARGADRRQSYELVIDGIQVATVRANMLGLIIFRQVSDTATADFPPVTEDSVVEIRGLATGDFITAREGVDDLLERL
jgi:hypothetical protein